MKNVTLEVAEVAPAFPMAKRSNERNTLKVESFKQYAKRTGVNFGDKAVVKQAMATHKTEKLAVIKQIKGAAILLLATGDYQGKKIQTWTNSKGVQQAQINVESVDETVSEEQKEKVLGAVSVAELEAALAKAKAAEQDEKDAANPVVDVDSTKTDETPAPAATPAPATPPVEEKAE